MVAVFDPEIPLPVGPVTIIVTVILAFGNEWVIFAVNCRVEPCLTLDGEALTLTELLRPTEAELLMPVANSESFAINAAAMTMMSNVITVTDTRSNLPSLLRPVATEPINLASLGVNARILPRNDTCYRKTSVNLGDASLKASRRFICLRTAIRSAALPQT